VAEELTAARFIERLKEHSSAEEREKIKRYFKSGPGEYGEGDVFIGARMGEVFAEAKEFLGMEPREIELLLESPIHEARAGAVSIMAKQASAKRTPESRKKELFELYLRRHDRINNWDLVDLGAVKVVGAYLSDKPRDVLYELAGSPNLWERRTAMFSTVYFARSGDLDDLYRIAQVLLSDEEDLIHKVVGGSLREAGKSDPDRLLRFLDEHAATMPRTTLRYAIERLDERQRKHYMGLKSA